MSDSYSVLDRVRLGYVMSSWLFNINTAVVMREMSAMVLGRGLKLVGANGE